MLGTKARGMMRRLGWEFYRLGGPQDPLWPVLQFIRRESIAVVLDVGANHGQFAHELRRSGYQGRIVSFEPQSAAHRVLGAAAASDPGWTVAPRMALGAEEGEAVINVSAFSQASSLLKPSRSLVDMMPETAASGQERAPCSRLDQVAGAYLHGGEKGLLKLDVQGFEKQVLEGAESVLPSISGILVELSVVALYDGQALAPEILDYLRRREFEMWYMRPAFMDPRTGQMLQYDVLAGRRSSGAGA